MNIHSSAPIKSALSALVAAAGSLPEPENFFAGVEAKEGLAIPGNILMFLRTDNRPPRIREYHPWLHHRHMLMILLEGACQLMLDDRDAYAMATGDLVLVRPFQRHYMHGFSKSYRLLFITFEIRQGGISEVPMSAKLEGSAAELLGEMVSDYLAEPRRSDLLTLRLALLLGQLRGRRELAAGEEPEGHELIQRLVLHIRQHLDRPLGADRMAAKFGLSAGHLRRVFRQGGVGNLGEFIRNARFEMAEAQLASTGAPIKEVAHACGFKSVPTFSREFQKRTGKSPRAFRQEFNGG